MISIAAFLISLKMVNFLELLFVEKFDFLNLGKELVVYALKASLRLRVDQRSSTVLDVFVEFDRGNVLRQVD